MVPSTLGVEMAVVVDRKERKSINGSLISSDHSHSSPVSRLFENLSSRLPRAILFFIRVQEVRKLGQLFDDLSSDDPIPSSSSVFSMYVNLVNCLKTSHLIIPSHFSSVSRSYVNLVDRLKTSHLIYVFLFICFVLQKVRKLCRLFEVLI